MKGQYAMNLSLASLLWSQVLTVVCCTAHSLDAVTLKLRCSPNAEQICLSTSQFVLLVVAAADLRGNDP